MMTNKYLTDIGLKENEIGTNFVSDNDKRAPQWEKERKTYGFDQRETWNLDQQFAQWLYSRLCMFEEVTIADTTKTKITIDEKEYTQEECINIIKDACKTYMLIDIWSDEFENAVTKMEQAMVIWGKILPAMWW